MYEAGYELLCIIHLRYNNYINRHGLTSLAIDLEVLAALEFVLIQFPQLSEDLTQLLIACR